MGFHQNAIARNVAAGQWSRPLANFYCTSGMAEHTEAQRRRALAHAYSRRSGGTRVASHWTAAELWGLPTSIFPQKTLAFTEDRSRHGTLRPRNITLFQRPLERREVTTIDGIACTSIARTVVDCSLIGGFSVAVCSMEAAMFFLLPFTAPRLTRDELALQLDQAHGRKNIAVARAAFGFAGTKSQSVFESKMRLFLRHYRIEQPEQQVTFSRADGSILTISDMAWRQQRTILECDGAGKYLDHLGGLTPRERLRREKERDRELQRRGFETIRATWRDLSAPDSLLGMLRDAGLYSPQ